jgi:hypothetical protein
MPVPSSTNITAISAFIVSLPMLRRAYHGGGKPAVNREQADYWRSLINSLLRIECLFNYNLK